MVRFSLDNEVSPLARAVELIGDGWIILIIWACANGISRFDMLQQQLGIARNILADRLRRLLEAGILERRPIGQGSKRMEYHLTARGEELRRPLAILNDWGLRHCMPDGHASPRPGGINGLH